MNRLLTLICALLLLSSCNAAPTEQKQVEEKKDLPTYKIGYMVCNSENETNHRFQPLTAYLSKKLNANFEMKAIDTTNFLHEIDTLDFTHTNSLLYIIMNRFHGVEVLATENKGSLGSRSQGVIIALAKSNIKTVKDLKGKSMLFGPTLAPTGFMAQVDLLQKEGLDPENDLAFYSVPKGSFKHEQVVYGVLFEKYDAGALPIDDVESMTADGKISADDFRIIAKAEPIPYCNFAVTQKIDPAFAEKFKQAILALTPETTMEYEGETIKILKRALVNGFEDAKDSDFDVVREMAKRVNMPPYQKY
ncbi:MAG: phosphate/phosphite/phosphonate ABC transporter substrate-binding protein [Desulfobulbaceae bacterium]|nr:phosphate/phosphite/phosphonate ABC transporter substrate-binding protein [Desulfobulbaceae bacterium]